MKTEYLKVNKGFLDYLILGNCKRIVNEASDLPNFKALNLGEGDPYPGEMEYIQGLQDLSEESYNAMKPVLMGKGSIDEKQRQLDTIANDYIQKGFKLISTTLPVLFKAGIVEANKLLAKHKELKQADPQELLKSTDLSDLIGYQQHNFQRWVNNTKDSLIDDLWIRQVFTIYK